MTDPMQRIIKDIQFFSGPQAAGRLSATDGARVAADYLAIELARLGYEPGANGKYFDAVDVPAPRFTGIPSLVVGDETLTFRRDYADLTLHTSGGVAEGSLLVIRDGDDVSESEIIGKVVLIPERPEGFDVRGTIDALVEYGAKGLLIEYDEPEWFHKSPFGSANYRIPVIRIRKSLAVRIATMKNVNVKIDLPISYQTLPCHNVLGYLSSPEQTEETLVLTAHYDHLGDDPGGERFPGAIDNASGVAIVLELARTLVAKQSTLPFNVLIVFLTGEETGMWGAKHLIANPPVKLSMVINFDSFGFEPDLHMLRVGHDERGHWLAELANEVIEAHGVQTGWIKGGDDSFAFISSGIDAIGLGQKPTTMDSIRIHSPNDNFENLNHRPIERGYSIARTIIETLINQNNLLKGGGSK